MQEFNNYLKINVSSKNTIVQYLSRINLFFSKYAEFNQNTVNDFLANCIDNNLKANTFNGYMNALKHYGKFIKLEIEYPKQRKPNKTKKSYLTIDELEKEVLPYFHDIFSDGELRKLVVRLLFTSGMRPCELIHLKIQDLDFKNNWITVRDTKDKEDRNTLFVPSLHNDIKELCKKSQSEKVFNIPESYIVYTFNKTNEMLQYKKHLNPYMLRHSFAHHCLKMGIDLKRLKEMMGHCDIKITEEYLTLDSHEIIDFAVKKFKFKKGGK